MRYEIILAPEAVADFKRFSAHVRSTLKAGIERHLRHEPDKTSRSRIKRLRGLSRPQYRLRIGEIRIFYDIRGNRVEILAIVLKLQSGKWLDQFGEVE